MVFLILNMNAKLRPVVYTTSTYQQGAPQTTQQVLLLKALQVTQDPKELRKMIGVKTVAEVYRTLDKLSIRREYHDALARAGLSLDFVVGGLKNIASHGEKDGDRLKAFQTLLKSLGLDKYDSADTPSGGSWEEVLLQSIGEDGSKKVLPAPEQIEDYEVKRPEMPERMKKLREEEEALTRGVYE